jgi:hypothetical protein
VGLDVAIEPQWQMLWTELAGAFNEPELFAPTIADSVASWAGALGEICDDESNEDWTEELLEKVKASGSMIRIELEVGQNQEHGAKLTDIGGKRWHAINCLVRSNPRIYDLLSKKVNITVPLDNNFDS